MSTGPTLPFWPTMCVLLMPAFASSFCAAAVGMGTGAATGQSGGTSVMLGAGCCLLVCAFLATRYFSPRADVTDEPA